MHSLKRILFALIIAVLVFPQLGSVTGRAASDHPNEIAIGTKAGRHNPRM